MSQTTSPDGDQRLPMLDLLRAVAALLVVMFHFGFRGAAADGLTTVSLPGLEPVLKYGYLGVHLFFIISGFVIAYSAEKRSALNFAVARIVRIYPGFLICMTLTFLVTLAFGGGPLTTNVTQWFGNLVIYAPAFKLAYMDGAYWSIVYELVFYVWVFALILAGVFRKHIAIIVLAWLTISFLNEAALHSGLLRHIFLTHYSAFFCTGLLLYEIFRGRRDFVIGLLLVLAIVEGMHDLFTNAAEMRDYYRTDFDNSVLAISYLAATAAVALAMTVRRVPLRAGLVLAIGGVTYPLYLLHQHIGYILLSRADGLAAAPVLVAAVAIGLTVVSLIIWACLERPAQRWLKRTIAKAAAGWHRSQTPSPAVVAAVADAEPAKPVSAAR